MSDLKMFALIERLEPGHCAKAHLLFWNGERYIPDRAAVIHVHDHLGHYGVAGDRGHCVLSEESGHWEVVNGLNVQLQMAL